LEETVDKVVRPVRRGVKMDKAVSPGKIGFRG
jgi:hypothetical protein